MAYGGAVPPIGVLMLDTTFERIPGDIGNPTTFDFPLRYHVVRGATTNAVVADAERARAHLPAFVEGARALERQGVRAITTSCGFLAVVQDELSRAVDVPVITSSLLVVPMVSRMIGFRPLAVVTADARQLSETHLRACGIEPGPSIVVRGMESSAAFRSAILSDRTAGLGTLDPAAICEDVVTVGRALQSDVPALGAIVLECTNLQPYAHALQRAVRLPVFGIVQLVDLVERTLHVPRYGANP